MAALIGNRWARSWEAGKLLEVVSGNKAHRKKPPVRAGFTKFSKWGSIDERKRKCYDIIVKSIATERTPLRLALFVILSRG